MSIIVFSSWTYFWKGRHFWFKYNILRLKVLMQKIFIAFVPSFFCLSVFFGLFSLEIWTKRLHYKKLRINNEWFFCKVSPTVSIRLFSSIALLVYVVSERSAEYMFYGLVKWGLVYIFVILLQYKGFYSVWLVWIIFFRGHAALWNPGKRWRKKVKLENKTV